MKKTIALFLSGLIISASLTIPAFGAVKNGAACPKSGLSLINGGEKFTCIKSGKKLVWRKVVAVTKKTQTPAPVLAPILKAEDLRIGLVRAEYLGYYDDDPSWFKSNSPWQTSVVTSIDIQTGQGDDFSIQWTGYFKPTETGKWTFTSISDDGSGVWIGESAIKQIPEGVAVLSAPGIHGPYTITKQKYLEKGNLYPLRILFGDKTNWAQMTFSVQAPSANKSNTDLREFVWHSPVSTESNSGIDPLYATQSMLRESNLNNSQIPVISGVSDLDSVDSCKLKSVNTVAMTGRGFPTPNGRLSTSGKIKGLVIFVEFDDVLGGDDTKGRFEEYTNKFKEFYKAQSYGQLVIDMDYVPKYFHIKKQSSSYGMQTHNGGDAWTYIRDSLNAADPFVDFSTYDFVVAIPPTDAKNIVYGPAFPMPNGNDYLQTSEKNIRNAAVAGTDSFIKPERSWFWLSHEVGHLFGLEHPYSFEFLTYSSEVKGIWDLMETGDNAPEFLAWHRFTLGWLDSTNIRCINRDTRVGTESIHFISPIESQDSLPKSIVVRLNEYEAIVLELRRNLGFDQISELDEGVIAYRVNVRDVGKSQEITILTNQPYSKGATIAGNMSPGDKLVDSSIEITILKSTKTGDYLKVKILQP
jgi:M6 family metalloprotease-like protein